VSFRVQQKKTLSVFSKVNFKIRKIEHPMTALATPEERNEILDKLVEALKQRDFIRGIALIGSGAKGFIDIYSDVDLLVLLKDDAIFQLSYLKVKEEIESLFRVVLSFEHFRNNEDLMLIAMLDNYLELDVQVVTARALIMRERNYKILYDPEEVLYDLFEDSFTETQMAAPRRIYIELIERSWQPILKCVGAINRDETWRALKMLEEIRDVTVQLAGMNHKISTKGYANVDKLPEMFLVNLRHTIPTSTSSTALRRALKVTVGMLFAEALTIELTLRLTIAVKMQEYLIPYVEAYS
jgi:predicted nucleotidyltransferase